MALSLHNIKGEVRPLHDRIMVSDMEFGEVTTKGGIILPSDDGQQHGIKPRWAKVVSKGHENTDDYNVGDWVLIEHGRWSRGFAVEDENGDTKVLRTVDPTGVLGVSDEAPSDLAYYGDAIDLSGDSHRPEDFVN
jgi:co-chaperonin GroES (HSP10)